MRRVILAALIFTVVPGAFSQEPPARKRVAVFDFDNAAVSGPSFVFFQSTPNIGKAMADLVVAKLVQDANVSVIERSALDKLLGEQNLTNSDRTDRLTAAKLGRILGVDAIILGTITHYDYEDKTTGGGGSSFGGMVGRTSMSTKHDIKMVVQVTARIVSPDTAEVLAVAQGSGDVFKKGVKVDIRDMSRVGLGGGGSRLPMNDASDKAVAQLSAQLEQNLAKLPPRIPVIEGVVADANEAGRLVLNVGSLSGVKQGDKLQVWRAGKEIRDPTNGRVLLRDDTLLGPAVVTTVNETFAIAEFQGSTPVKTGDLVKSMPKQ
jgi:curli biogenesis system outer membrane secretion channel CsgG